MTKKENTMIRHPMMKLIWGVLFICLMAPATADVLLIEKVRERMQRDLPENGLSMEQVERRYGSPNQKSSAVGEPPITRWTFDDYSVYFEYQLVIDSVLHHEAVVREVREQR
jgi:hypothetical protein